MKKFLILVSMLTLGLVSTASADAVQSLGSPDNGAWFMQVNADTSFPTANLANQVNQGWGGEGSIGYRFPQNFEFAVESGYDTYSTSHLNTTGMWNVVPLVLKLQYNVGYSSTKPYLFVAGGFAFNSKSANYFGGTISSSETDFLEEAGIGLSFEMMSGTVFFVQGKVEVDNTTGAYASDVPTIVFPINVGWKFSLD
jgi:opacity protein-like surface antigen